jgi:hypothetical protein
VGGGIGITVGGADMTAGAEFTVQLTGKIVQFFNRGMLPVPASRIKKFSTGCGVYLPGLTLPGQLDVADHAGVGLHDGGLNPFLLVAVTGAAGCFPAAGGRRIGRAVHSGMGRLFLVSFGIATVTGDAGGVCF